MKPRPGLFGYGFAARRIWYFVFACVLCGQLWPFVCSAQVLTISKVDHNDVTDDVVREILTTAYQRIGVTLVFKELPAARALAESSGGIVDGEFQRRGGLSATYPDLLQINIPVNWLDFCVFTRDANFKPNGWKSLQPYHIGYHRGIVVIEEGTKGMNVDPADTNELVMRKLFAGRTDIAVMNSIDGQLLLRNMSDKSIHMLMPPVEHLQLYHYLNRKNADIAKKLEKALLAMQADGSIVAIRKRILATAGIHE
jgi:polar amino acid transport system substrate-binding protein